MDEFSNELTAGELERLALLAEEAGEVVQIVNKIIRHGYESYNPFDDNQRTNRSLLEKELGDLTFAVRLLSAALEVNKSNINLYANDKAGKVGRWFHHQNLERVTELTEPDFAQSELDKERERIVAELEKLKCGYIDWAGEAQDSTVERAINIVKGENNG